MSFRFNPRSSLKSSLERWDIKVNLPCPQLKPMSIASMHSTHATRLILNTTEHPSNLRKMSKCHETTCKREILAATTAMKCVDASLIGHYSHILHHITIITIITIHINPHQSTSIHINPHQSTSIHINPSHQSIHGPTNARPSRPSICVAKFLQPLLWCVAQLLWPAGCPTWRKEKLCRS